jgi:hypothetical protein
MPTAMSAPPRTSRVKTTHSSSNGKRVHFGENP